jgi:hypothetical protein
MDKRKYSKAVYPYPSQNNTAFHIKYEDERQVISSVRVIWTCPLLIQTCEQKDTAKT